MKEIVRKIFGDEAAEDKDIVAHYEDVQKLAIDEYAQQFNQWTTVKPDFKEECVLVTANKWDDNWHYVTWIIKLVNHGDGPYMACLTGDGNEWGDLADLTADKYLILPKHGD